MTPVSVRARLMRSCREGSRSLISISPRGGNSDSPTGNQRTKITAVTATCCAGWWLVDLNCERRAHIWRAGNPPRVERPKTEPHSEPPAGGASKGREPSRTLQPSLREV